MNNINTKLIVGNIMKDKITSGIEINKIRQGDFQNIRTYNEIMIQIKYQESTKDKINNLVKEHKNYEAQKLYFENINEQRKNLIRI